MCTATRCLHPDGPVPERLASPGQPFLPRIVCRETGYLTVCVGAGRGDKGQRPETADLSGRPRSLSVLHHVGRREGRCRASSRGGARL